MSRKGDLESVKHLVSTKLRELLPAPALPVSEAGLGLLHPKFSDHLAGGEPCQVIAGIEGKSLRIYLFGISWELPYMPVVSPSRFRTIPLASLPADPEKLGTVLKEAITAASEARHAEFQTCRFCQRSVPPEHRYDESTCHSCATRELGVVY